MGDKAQKIRINELARELEVKAGAILEILPQVGIEGKKTHSSSVDAKTAGAIRDLLQKKSDLPPTPSSAPTVSSPPRGSSVASPAASPKLEPTGIQPPVPIVSQPSLRIAGSGTPLRPPVREFRPPLKPPTGPGPGATTAPASTRPAAGASPPPAAPGGRVSPGVSIPRASRGKGVAQGMSPEASAPRGASGLRPTSRSATGPPTVPATPVKPIPSEAKGHGQRAKSSITKDSDFPGCTHPAPVSTRYSRHGCQCSSARPAVAGKPRGSSWWDRPSANAGDTGHPDSAGPSQAHGSPRQTDLPETPFSASPGFAPASVFRPTSNSSQDVPPHWPTGLLPRRAATSGPGSAPRAQTDRRQTCS